MPRLLIIFIWPGQLNLSCKYIPQFTKCGVQCAACMCIMQCTMYMSVPMMQSFRANGNALRQVTMFWVKWQCFRVNGNVFLANDNALWRKLLRNFELRILPKLWPWLSFSLARVISDKNIWMFSPLQFHFQFMFGYELKAVEIAKESVAIHTGCGKDANRIEGTSWT